MVIDEIMQAALEITQAQASVRPMSAVEVVAYSQEVARGLRAAQESLLGNGDSANADPRASIKESSVTCLECGRTFKVLTIRHLSTHGLDAKSYKEKYGLKKSTSLACKSLLRDRRKKMKDMRLWERKKNAKISEMPEETVAEA